MVEEIQELFANKSSFATIIAQTMIEDLEFEVYTFTRSALSVDIIITPKKQFIDLKAAFSALFKKELFESEEWPLNDESTFFNEEAQRALKKFWIEAYFPTFNKENVKSISADPFFSRLRSDLRAVQVSEITIEKFIKKLANPEIIQIQSDHLSVKLFGQSDRHYFFFDYGIYD